MKMFKHMYLILAVLALSWGSAQAALRINEIRIDNDQADTDEYAEIKGDPGESLDDVWYLQIGDHSGDGASKGSGVVEFAIDLTGEEIPASGYYLIGNPTMTLIDVAEVDWYISENSFENSDNITHLLVRGYTGPEVTSQDDQLGDLAVDIDGDDAVGDIADDGVPNAVLPWTSIIDAIGFIETTDSGEWYYGEALGFEDIGPDGFFVPGQIYRYEDTGEWNIGVFQFSGGTDTPKAANPNAPTAPIFSSFSENYLNVGETLVITGTNLSDVTSVSIAGTEASFSIISDTTIEAVVPDADYGPVVLTSPGGSTTTDLKIISIGPSDVLILEENFTAENSLGGFTAFSLASALNWEWRIFGGDGYAYMSGYAAGAEDASDDWLVSPAIDFTNITEPVVHFQTMANFTGPDLQVYISTDYDGSSSPDAGFTWTELTGFDLSSGGYALTDSGLLELDAYAGQVVYIAFRYTSEGSGNGQGKTYEITQVLAGGTMSGVSENLNPWVDLPHSDGWVEVALSDTGTLWIYDANWPHIYSAKHGWIYADARHQGGLYLYNFNDDVGWLFTAEGLYPVLFSLDNLEWGWFDMGSSLGSRMFYIYTGGTGWITVPDES